MTAAPGWGFYAMLAQLALLGFGLAAPTPGELGFVDEMTCAEALSEPRSLDAVRLTECAIDLAGDPLIASAPGATTHLVVDPEALDPAQLRLRERDGSGGASPHATLTGQLTRTYASGDAGLRLSSHRRQPYVRIGGVVLALFALGSILLRRFFSGGSGAEPDGRRPTSF